MYSRGSVIFLKVYCIVCQAKEENKMGHDSNYTDKMILSAYRHLEAIARLGNYRSIPLNRCMRILVDQLRISENFARFILRRLADDDHKWISNEEWEIHVKPLNEIEEQIQRILQ
jgi:hypothetical protein